MRMLPRFSEIYKNFEGHYFFIDSVANHFDSKEPLVICYMVEPRTERIANKDKFYFEHPHDPYRYAIPLDTFMSMVNKKKYPNCKQKNMFELV